eukprot:CAMPEP_0118964318 /NCGR_PEP_ID=MMETSP1173-20130426/2042_1 /TAXON_ID=1034831 /ORGANISM="Rhizochromulina marina cf, Strain CCMP1243" /LENGTH=72 /DNA_ID=CAMNT_0006912759 /DNA_START=127 /DNA_END=341 /DNA_ORIENTATION=+
MERDRGQGQASTKTRRVGINSPGPWSTRAQEADMPTATTKILSTINTRETSIKHRRQNPRMGPAPTLALYPP